jgi:hydrogenase maturation factor HypF (carbamoyltransferase family)
MKKLYSSQNRVVIYVLKETLESQGILCFIKNENPPLAGEIPPAIACPELWCMDDEQHAKAKIIIANEQAARISPQDAWVCPKCSEELEGQFELCWQCGTQRD